MADQHLLEIEGMTAQEAFNLVVKQGLNQSEAAILVSSWIFEHFGKTRRTFNYTQAFPAVEPDCVAQFVRTFLHTDWVDGESVVQAEQTVGEEGFNVRFHRIETDLEALGTDVKQAFACLTSMRQRLRVLLDELRAEINRLNNDIFECCSKGNAPGIIVDKFPSFGGLVDTGKFLGTTTFSEKPVSIWQTDRGILVLPAVHTIGPEVLTDVRVMQPGNLARFIEEAPEVRAFFAQQPVTKENFVQRFGDERTRDGQSIREVLNILPNDMKFASLEALVNEVAERQAAAIRTSSGANAAIASAFGLESDIQTVANASIERMETIPSRARAVLLRNGLGTMEKLAGANAREVAGLMAREGIESSIGEAASWTATAKTFASLR